MTNNKVKKDINALKRAVGQTETEQTTDSDQYFPGAIRIVDALNDIYHFKTIPEIGTDRESIFGFNGEIYIRAEEQIKEVAHQEFIRQWTNMKENAKKSGDIPLFGKLSNCLNRGPTSHDIEEVLAMIRRTTFTKDRMNPTSHIPFRNGLLNLNTRKLESFTPDLFYTYQIDANLLSDRYITLKNIPMFEELMSTAYYDTDIPMILSYFAYAFYPGFPAHRVLFILGRERIGKGTSVRVLQGIMPKGSGSMSLARMLTGERFQFTGIEGKNLLIDAETKRTFRRGTVLDWSAFCNLFGEDTLSLENKGREARDYLSIAKGIVLANLPFIPVDSAPAIARALVVETKNERPKREVKDLHKLILESERDQIATLLMEILFKLIDRDFNFPGQLTDDSTADIMEQLADPVSFFIDDETERVEGDTSLVEATYKKFIEWCKKKGITALTRQTFVQRFGKTYHKRKISSRGSREYFFINCHLNGDNDRRLSQEKLQVGHEYILEESLKLSLSGERYRRVQHAYTYPTHTRESNHDHSCIKDDAHKLDTEINISGNTENKPPGDIEPVSGLNDNVQSPQSERIDDPTVNCERSEVQDKTPITKEEGEQVIKKLHERGIHLNAADTRISIYGDKFNIAVPVRFYRQNTAKVDQAMEELGFVKGNAGTLNNVFFSRPLKGGKPA